MSETIELISRRIAIYANNYLVRKLGILIDHSAKHCAVADVNQVQRLLLKLLRENLSTEMQPHFNDIGMELFQPVRLFTAYI